MKFQQLSKYDTLTTTRNRYREALNFFYPLSAHRRFWVLKVLLLLQLSAQPGNNLPQHDLKCVCLSHSDDRWSFTFIIIVLPLSEYIQSMHLILSRKGFCPLPIYRTTAATTTTLSWLCRRPSSTNAAISAATLVQQWPMTAGVVLYGSLHYSAGLNNSIMHL